MAEEAGGLPWKLKTLRVLETLRVYSPLSILHLHSPPLALWPGPCYNIYTIVPAKYDSESKG
jgi:hypothetical protein